MCNGGIVKEKPMKKVSFSLEALQLEKCTRRRKFENGLNFERVKGDTIFGYNKAKNSVSRNAKDTLKGI